MLQTPLLTILVWVAVVVAEYMVAVVAAA